jgi:L-fuconolactonase
VAPSIGRVIDSHFHLWRRAQAQQSGILAAPYLQRDFRFEDLAAAAGPELEAGVEVQVNDFTDGTREASFVAGVARTEPRLAGHIAWARLESPAVEQELEALARIPVVRGVRRTCQIEADPDFCASGAYVRGARLLAERGWLCEICVRGEQIRSLARLARGAPETRIVLQHIGKPDLAQPPTTEWLRTVEELGRLANVTCKLSVVVHAADDAPYAADRVAPFVRHLVDCLGWERLLFGSNWPVALAVTGYREWVAMLRELLVDCGAGEDELAAVFSVNARRLYGIATASGR